mgnify:CR=1 FL=1
MTNETDKDMQVVYHKKWKEDIKELIRLYGLKGEPDFLIFLIDQLEAEHKAVDERDLLDFGRLPEEDE